MNPFIWLNTQTWTRPALMILTGLAYIIKTFVPGNTIANHIAGGALPVFISLGAGSVGLSNSSLPPGSDK